MVVGEDENNRILIFLFSRLANEKGMCVFTHLASLSLPPYTVFPSITPVKMLNWLRGPAGTRKLLRKVVL